jgi:hypothetical protein
MKVFIFGNGNIDFQTFMGLYQERIIPLIRDNATFIVCDFRGADTLAIELLKHYPNVELCYMGGVPRYMPDKFKTQAGRWKFTGGFKSDTERDEHAISQCTHFIGFDFNSDDKRISGTAKNIAKCVALGKIPL